MQQGNQASNRRKKMIGKIRPQVFLAIIILGILAVMGLHYSQDQVSTAALAGIVALAMQILQNE
tara:strand:+ start:372 stop:563 length:192 start_codon:yes stop_codon:yes gene_type:complete